MSVQGVGSDTDAVTDDGPEAYGDDHRDWIAVDA
jgi:hypothetical protein